MAWLAGNVADRRLAGAGVAVRIRFITRKWPPAIGGMETYSVKLTEALSVGAELEVTSLAGRTNGQPPRAIALLWFGLATAASILLRRRPPEVMHIGDMALWPLGWLSRLRARCRVAISAHGTDVSYPLRGGVKGTAYGWYLRLGGRLMRRAVVIANSEATAEAARRYGFGRVTVVPLATDLRPPSPAVAVGAHILFAGRLVPRKGCAWFVHNVLDQLPEDVSLSVAGTAWHADEAAALDHPRVTDLGPQPPAAMPELYAGALCVIVPNIDVPNGEFEGFGLVATEAAACGGVVLAAAHSGLREAVVDGVTGFSLPPGDADAWVERICAVRAWTARERGDFVEGAIAESQRRYSWPRVADETRAAYQLAE